ncbi:MAG: hypothetical protein ACOY9J_13350 [Pseudomonadota bacterium]
MKNYDDLIPAAPPEQPAAPSGNKYDEIIDAPDTPPVQVMAVSLSALSRNPEQSAKARTLGQRYGLPPSVIERNLPELEKRALQDTNSAVLQRSPKLSRFIGADPDRAAVAVDDLPTFGEIERTLGTPLPRRWPLTGAFKDAAAEARRTRDRFERALTGARSAGRAEETPVDYSIADRVRYGYGQARAGLPIVMNELTGLYEGDQFGLALAISDRLREAERANLATPPAAVTEGARRVGEAEGFVESGAAVLGSPAFVLDTVFTSLGQSAPSMLAGVAGAAAGPAGQALGAGTGSLAVEYSASLIESIREAGLTPTNAQEVYRALSDPALMDQARDKALKRGLAIGAFDALTAGLAGNILRNARGASRTAMAAAVAGEAGLQAAGGAGGELVAQLLTESNVRWGEVFLEGIAEIASGVVEVPSNLRTAREAAEARFARNDHNAMLAEYHANQVKQLSELAGASKVLARDPQTLQEFIDNVAREGGRVEDIYVDARQFAQTVGDEKLAELRQASPAVAAQIDEALAIGGDLVISLGEFATTIGQSDVMPSVLELVRPDAAEMSLAEAKQFAQTRDDQMLAEAERALEEAGEASDFSRSAATVEQRVTQELQTANRFTEAVNTRYAKLVSAFFTTMAKRTGVLPEQFAARYSLQVRNGAVQGERRMEQGEEVFDWSNPGGKGVGGHHFRDTKVGDTTISYGIGRDGTAEIISVRTPQAKRRNGSARRALEAFLREADERGFVVGLWSSPLDKKTDGRRLFDFYRSLGFEPTGRKINQVGDPEMIRPPRAFNQSAFTADTIEIDGKTRPALNSNGQRIAQTEEGLRNFWRWFGDSKVVDAEGRPLVVYHGTNKSVEVFDPAKIGARDSGFFGSGFYFTPDEDIAFEYADSAVEDAEDGESVVLSVYVALRNPFVWDMSGEGAATTRAALAAVGIKRADVRGNSASLGDAKEREIFNRLVREQGYDGIVVRDEDGIQEVVAFDSTQIKSATGNRGTFDPADPKILNQSAYHGTPHRGIDKFSTDKIGTGEGAQAYGWGLYFASKREIAEYYRKNLAAGFKDAGWAPRIEAAARESFSAFLNKFPNSYRLWIIAADAAKGQYGSLSEYADQLISRAKKTQGQMKPLLERDIEVIRAGGKEAESAYRAMSDELGITGQLYEVEIPEDDVMLLWDKPLSEQPDVVARSARTLKGDIAGDWLEDELDRRNADWEELTGQELYKLVQKALVDDALVPNRESEAEQAQIDGRTDKAASLLLADDGIKGIKYLDGTSRGAGDGSYNYVIFSGDDAVIRRQFYQSAYHGTPHRFERFSLEHIGAGEGVQAFGWGLYFTSERDIAEWYRRKLSEDQAVVNWRIGNRYIVRDEQIQDYSPRPASGDIGQAWSVAVEGLMLAESELRDTLYAGGDVRAKAAEILDEIIEIEKSGDYRQSFIFHLERIRDQARDGMVFDLTEAQGQVYQVNIPDKTEMLAWDKPLSEQPEKVREALAEATETALARYRSGLEEAAREQEVSNPPVKGAFDPELEAIFADPDFQSLVAEAPSPADVQRRRIDSAVEGMRGLISRKTGEGFYKEIADIFGGDEAASKYLNSIGVRGISYQADGGRTDARNFVVFDDSAIEVLNAFYQRQEALRGQITFGADITRTPSVISLFEQANLSTFLHESGHFFLEVMADVAARGAQPQVMDDMDALLRWFGVPDLGTWLAMTPDQQRPYHEQFARGFERYLLEGKAPARSLESLFATFRSWLVSVYRSLIGSAGGADAALNVTVSDEVRSVMDRMIASDEEIAEAQDARRYAPLFKSAAEMGATTAEWAAYQREHGDALEAAQAQLGARSLREMRWLSGAKSRELKRLQGEAKAARAAVEEEATAEVRAEPVYAAMRWLKHGEMVNAEGEQIKALSGFKLDAERAREILTAGGLESTALGVGKYGMVAKEGLDPQVVAEMFGFPNGETLIHAIVGATPEADAIEALTDQRMLERYGELVDDRAMERAADAAVHNEARGRFVAVELRALTRALNKQARTPAGGSVNALARAARELADRIVLRKPIKDIKPAKFSTAEVRAAKAAEKALAGNDLTTAVTEKRNQMVNFYAARAAHNALGRFEVGLRKMKRALESEGIDQEYRDQIAAILDRYNLRPMTKKEQQRAKSLVAWVDAQKAAGYEPVIDEDVLNEARRVPVRDLTVEEFDGLVASVENIAHLGRLKKKLLTAKDAREFAARVDEAEAAIRDNATRTVPEQIEKGRLARFRSGVKEFFVMHRKFANTIYEMDGWRDGGALWELFVRPMNEAGDREAVMREQATIRLSELFKAVSKDARRKVFIPEIDTALTAEARIMVALNTGNAGNLQRLMDGDRWSIDQVKAITDTLTKEQWDFVQGVWDLINEYRPQIAEQQKRITGVEPKWVESTPVDTPHGIYRGGYFPAKYDTDRSTRSLSDEAAAGVMDQWRATRGAARTRDSFTRERAAKVVMRPLRKDFGVVTQHITEVTHRLAWQEYLIDATRLLNASQIDAAIREHYGPEVLRSMRDTIADVAAGEVGAQNAFEKAINHLRVGTTIVGLGWNLTTGLLQPIGLTQSMVRIGPKWVAKGLAQWLGDAVRMESSAAAVYEKSEFMRLRGKTMQREISEIRNTVSGTDSRIAASYFYFIQKLQIVADMPTWLGMYTKAIETMNVDEATAVALADQAVLDAQSGGQVKDLAAIQRGGPMLKLFTNFYSFFNTTFNLTRAAYGRTDFYKPGEAGLFLVDMLLLYTVPAVLGTLLKAALHGDTDDDEDELVKKLIADQMNYLLGTMVGLREIGGATAAALGLPSGYSGPAGVRFFSEVQKLAKQVEQGEADAAFFKALNSSAGILFHYPAGQLNRTAEGVDAYLNGETENPAALIVGPPR